MASTRTEKGTTSKTSEPGWAAAREGRDGPWRRRYRIARRSLGAAVLPIVAPSVLRALARTWSVRLEGEGHYEDAFRHPGRLLSLWHGRMLVSLPHHRDRGMCVLVSPSDDGSLILPLLARFGQRVIRGSSNKESARALRAMLRELEAGGTVVVTPDGPRGPRHSMNLGLAWLAKVTGFPVLPCGFVCDRAWHLKSWDRFTIPRPRARLALVYGEPLLVERDADDAALARATDEIRARMLAAERRGFELLETEPDW